MHGIGPHLFPAGVVLNRDFCLLLVISKPKDRQADKGNGRSDALDLPLGVVVKTLIYTREFRDHDRENKVANTSNYDKFLLKWNEAEYCSGIYSLGEQNQVVINFSFAGNKFRIAKQCP